MSDSTRKTLARAGIKIRRARNAPPLTAVFRLLRVGEEFTASFSHKTAPYSFARAAGVRISTRYKGRGGKGKGVKMTVERVA